jgi:hypothetical protein
MLIMFDPLPPEFREMQEYIKNMSASEKQEWEWYIKNFEMDETSNVYAKYINPIEKLEKENVKINEEKKFAWRLVKF